MTGLLKVWSKFSATSKKDGTVINFRIVETPSKVSEHVTDLYQQHFMTEESTMKAAGVSKNTEAIKEIQGVSREAAKEKEFHQIICCLDNNDDEIGDIVGASTMVLTTKGEPEPEFKPKTEEINKLFEIFHGLSQVFDEMKEFNLDHMFIDRGLVVHPEYRGLGIAQEFLKVRRMICKEYGISINGAWMTSYGTQKAAERDGWETVCEVQYEELGKKHGVIFENGPLSCKFMIARIN